MSIAASFRKINAKIISAQDLANQPSTANTTKVKAARIIKAACPALRIIGRKYHILDILLGMSRADSWADDCDPVVTPSNQYLAHAAGCSERSVSRHLKALVEEGLLAYRDSQTGRRFATKSGELYGLTFAPARARLDELEALTARHKSALDADREAKRRIGRALRGLEDLKEQAERSGVPFDDFEAQAADIKEMAAPRTTKAEALDMVLEAATRAMAEALSNNADMTWSGDKTDTHLHNTNPKTFVSCNHERTCAKAQDIRNSSDIANRNEMALEREPCGGHPSPQPLPTQGEAEISSKPASNSIKMDLVQAALTQTQEDFGMAFHSWPDLLSKADALRAGIGLSQSAFNLAKQSHGAAVAALCVAVISEKWLRGGDITSPGGYFRGMIAAADRGELHLDRSLHALVASKPLQ